MMASSCNQQCFLLSLVALVWTFSQAISVTDSETLIHIRGEVGGNVTIHCPADKKKKVTFFYFQTNTTFVNGYYDSKDVSQYGPIWENTRVDHNEKVVYMYNLNISHSRYYQCIIQYKDGVVKHGSILLSVTANYTKPTFSKVCEDGHGCLVKCASRGGYPGTEMMWNIPISWNTSTQMWKVVNSSKEPSQSTTLFNSYSTAYFNCSKGKMSHLSCSVGEVTSDTFSVCESIVTPATYNLVIVAVVVVLVIFVIVVLLLCHFKRQKGGEEANVKQLKRIPGEDISLNVEAEAS